MLLKSLRMAIVAIGMNSPSVANRSWVGSDKAVTDRRSSLPLSKGFREIEPVVAATVIADLLETCVVLSADFDRLAVAPLHCR